MLAGLNEQQRQAVQHRHTPLLVLAGAGSGKTGVITRKIVWLIDSQGVDPEHIVAVTFTNKAAREMQQRVRQLLGRKLRKGPAISTFHALGYKLLRQEMVAAGLRRGFSLFDPRDSVQVVADLMRREVLLDNTLVENIRNCISRWKNAAYTPETIPVEEIQGSSGQAALRVYPQYQRHLQVCNAVDLDDLIMLPQLLLQQDEALQKRWQMRIRYLLVDEYQDTNGAQYALLRQLTGKGNNLTVVGDDDQSIYAWRGARAENLQTLRADFPDLQVIKLQQNYRSCNRILRVANALIEHNPRVFSKSLWSHLGEGSEVRVVAAGNDEREAEQLVAELMQLRFRVGAAYKDFAILYRSNHQARVFERKLRELQVPYYLSGGQSFFDRSEIRDVMAYLRLLGNVDDDNALLRVINTPRRGIGTATLEQLGGVARERRQSLYTSLFAPELAEKLSKRAQLAVQHFTDWFGRLQQHKEVEGPVIMLRQLLTDIEYVDYLQERSDTPEAAQWRWNNIEELLGWLERLQQKQPAATLSELVAKMTLIGVMERQDDEKTEDVVSLMTLHAAKGLEFEHVFIAGVEEELLPHRVSMEEDGVEEERRLFYVGITRARRSLTLSYCRQRRRYGEVIACEPSRFLQELPAEDLQRNDRAPVDTETRQRDSRQHLADIRRLLAANGSR